MSLILSNIHTLFLIYYFTLHKRKIKKYNDKMTDVRLGQICYSCHEPFEFKPFELKFEHRICKSCERHSKITSLNRSIFFNKIKLRSLIINNNKKILLFLIILSLIFPILSIILGLNWLNSVVSIIWIYFIINDYIMVKPVKI